MTEYIDKAALYKQIADYEQEQMQALLSEKNYNTPQALEKQGLLNSATIIKHMIADFPAADVRPVVRGEWIRQTDTRFGPKLNDIIICSVCNIAFSSENQIRRSFCPNCGADMREVKNEN